MEQTFLAHPPFVLCFEDYTTCLVFGRMTRMEPVFFATLPQSVAPVGAKTPWPATPRLRQDI